MVPLLASVARVVIAVIGESATPAVAAGRAGKGGETAAGLPTRASGFVNALVAAVTVFRWIGHRL